MYPLENFPIFKALQGEPSTAEDIEMDRGDESVSLEFWARPVRDEAGNVESAMVAFQDITERKRSEIELADYRRHLESMVGKRTEEVNIANKELRLRVEWLSAIVLINEIMAGSYEFTQIYEKIIEIINRLFSFQDSFIAGLDASGKQLKILSHSCHREHHPDLQDSFTTLPENVQFDPNPGQAKLIFFSKEQVSSMSGPMGDHMQLSNLQALVLLPLIMREQVFGFLGMELSAEGRNITSEEANLLGVFSIDIAQLIEISRLYEHTRMLITAEERNRLARELHDSVTQTLFTASVLAEATPRLWDKDQAIARQNMDKLSLLIRGALAEMRTMLFELRSEDLITQTLEQLLITLVEAARARTNAVINVSIMDIPELPKELTLTLYRIAREALNNALVHAAAARINISLQTEPGHVDLRIQDDGCGFDPQSVAAGHLGIRIMTERAAEIGGEVRIQSEPGRGTDILITCPINPGASAEND